MAKEWKMIRELDIVVLSRDIEEYGLRRDDIGVVVHCYKDDLAFEVEFVTGEGETVGLVTLAREDIRPMGRREILHVRELV
jgi:hypothetical protein